MSPATRFLVVSSLIVILLHVWGAVAPGDLNWGVHQLGFFGMPWLIGSLLVFLIAAVPSLQKPFADRFDRIAKRLGSLPPVAAGLLMAVIIGGLILLVPDKLHLLGDGAILLRSASVGMGSPEISQSFRNQPLMFWIYRWAMNFHPVDTSPDPYTVYLTIDIIASVFFIALLIWILRLIKRPAPEKILLGLFLFFGAGSQMLIGYVENYVLLYVITIAFLLAGWLSLEGRLHIAIPVGLAVCMVLFHLGAVVFAPAVLALLLLKWRANLRRASMVIGILAVIGVVGLRFVGFNMIDATRHLTTGSVDFLQPFTAIGGNFPYPMFGWAHCVDWLNDMLLAAPLGLFMVVILVAVIPRDQRRNNPALIFLGIAALCGFFFTWVINSALGLARDWDLFVTFFTPLLVLPVYLLVQTQALRPRRYALILVVVVSGIHWAAWIGLNSSPEKHLARMETIRSPRFLSLAARMTHDEALANFFFDNGRYADARRYYEDFMSIDSTNPRIIGNIADVYRRLGMNHLYFRELQRAVRVNTADPGVYSNLGVEYAMRGDTTEAIRLNKKAIEKNATMQKAYANLGVLYGGRRDYSSADRYFRTAMDLGMREPLLYRYAADNCVHLGDYRRAIEYYDSYLNANPGDRNVQSIRNRVYQELTRTR